MYQTLYRKYRPLNFNEVVGQRVIIKTLQNAISNGTLSHAYLFTGPRGTGKTSVAKILAKTINCTNLKENIPCNKCVNCTQNNINPVDILEIDAASNNGVDEIRELKSKINLVPSMGKYKTYIIDEVHMLSTGAFNALLKTLEEPPNHAIFILATTDPHKIPLTILSRCQRFDFKKLNIKEIADRLDYIIEQEKIKIEKEAIKEIAILSDGGMRDALSLLDQVIAYSTNDILLEDIHEINGTITTVEQQKFLKNIILGDIDSAFVEIDNYDLNGKDFIKLTEAIIKTLRNLLLKLNAPNFYINNKVNSEEELDIEKIGNEKILNYIWEFNKGINEMKQSNYPRLIFELIIIKIMNPEDKQKLDLKEIRINNTLYNFNKQELLEFVKNIGNIEKSKENKKYDEYISLILKGSIRAMGGENIIIVLDNIEEINKFNNNLEIIDQFLFEKYKIKYKIISVSKEEWEKIKKEYNNKEKKYEYINE